MYKYLKVDLSIQFKTFKEMVNYLFKSFPINDPSYVAPLNRVCDHFDTCIKQWDKSNAEIQDEFFEVFFKKKYPLASDFHKLLLLLVTRRISITLGDMMEQELKMKASKK